MSPATARTHAKLALVAGPYITSLRVPHELHDMVRSTLRDLVQEDNRPTPFSSIVEVQPGGTYRIMADGRTYRSGIEAESVPDCLVRMLLLAELDAHPERLHLHAGAVADQGRGVVVAGYSGSGKSTLVTSLVRAGFDYLSDERVAIDAADLTVSSFPKPLSLVGGTFDVFPELHPDLLGYGQATDYEWQIPASAVGTGAQLTELSARVIAFVNYEAGADVAIEQIHPITAVARLLHDSPDVARYRGDALSVCGRLCTSALCVQVTYSRPADVGPATRALLDDAERGFSPPDVEIIEAGDVGAAGTYPDDIVGTDRLVRTPSHTILIIDGRSLLHTEHDQALVELDDGSTAWLMLLDGTSTVDELIDVVHTETGIDRADIEQGAHQALGYLAANGLVDRAG